VSGTIGAIGNNGIGVAGVNWTTAIMALKFLDSSGSGSVSDAIDAIEFGLQAKQYFGTAANLRVLSNSWGGSGFSQALLNEINRANTADVLFVVAAGNAATNDDTALTYPASYNASNMITVAATSNMDSLASFSNYGPTTVHLGAPGVNILSTLPGSAYGYLSGTSMATPHVAGAAMLVLSACSLNTSGVKNALLANVDPVSSLGGVTVTGGRLNVNRAIHSCAAPVVNQVPQNISVTPGSGTGTNQVFTATYSDGLGYQDINEAWFMVAGDVSGVAGCFAKWVAASNTLYLGDDAARVWMGPIQAGSGATLQNSQCVLNASTSSASGAGNMLTVRFAFSFASGFGGTKNTYLNVFGSTGTPGWQQQGTWIAP